MSSVQSRLDLVLPRVEKPARYIGGEPYSVIREPGDDILRFCFCFSKSSASQRIRRRGSFLMLHSSTTC